MLVLTSLIAKCIETPETLRIVTLENGFFEMVFGVNFASENIFHRISRPGPADKTT